jgi:hypothetical protein
MGNRNRNELLSRRDAFDYIIVIDNYPILAVNRFSDLA